MMIRTAGGPGLVSPIDFHERKTRRFSRTTWTALGIVIAAHLGVGVALYYQRFDMAPPIVADELPPTIIELIRLKPEPIKPVDTPRPAQATNTKVNDLPSEPLTNDTVAVHSGEKAAEGSIITLTEPAPDAVDHGTVTEPVPPAPVITNPSWLRKPSGEQLMRAYPDRALRAEVGGSATLNCLVQADGRVSNCNVTRETPGGYGFGRAAQNLARHFQMNPRTVNGAAQGARVDVAIRFDPPE